MLRGLNLILHDFKDTLTRAAVGDTLVSVQIGTHTLTLRQAGPDVAIDIDGTAKVLNQIELGRACRLFAAADRYRAAAYHSDEYDEARSLGRDEEDA